jgi:hypothetical protein
VCLNLHSNICLYDVYKDKDPNIVEDIKIGRLGWAGHIIRMEEERIPKRVLNETSIPKDQSEDQEPDGQTWFRGMLYNCWGLEDGRAKLQIGMNRDVL